MIFYFLITNLWLWLRQDMFVDLYKKKHEITNLLIELLLKVTSERFPFSTVSMLVDRTGHLIIILHQAVYVTIL